MADPNTYTTKSPRLDPLAPQNQTNPSKFYTHFLYKSIIVSIFFVILPFFHSQAPEFINQTLHNRSWEFLQLIFVGIAVSYGLFSKRNEEIEKDSVSKFDNAHSYVSRLLHVSSVFDDEIENPCGSDDNNKVQTWNSQYYRGEPMVVVAQESSVLEEQSGKNSHMVEKPLLLPVRSLKSRVNGESNIIQSLNESISDLDSVCRSSSKLGSKRFSGNSNHSSKSRNGEFGGGKTMDLEGQGEENVVLRSPIPWKSRSGRMELKEELNGFPLFSLPQSMEDSELNRLDSLSFRSQFSQSSRSNSSSSSSPKNLSPQNSFSSESQSKKMEDLARKKTYHKSSPPPPPPPPPTPPLSHHRPPLRKLNSGGKYSEIFPGRELKRSGRSVPEEMSWSETEEIGETEETADFLGRGNSGAEWASVKGKSIRTIKGGEMESNFMERRGDAHKFNGGNFPPVSKQTTNFPKEERKEFVKDFQDSESEEEEEEEEDEFEEKPEKEMISPNIVSDGGPDVDKKADEFIAKFREQIRLQRIASIRKSTAQIPRNSVR